MSCPISRLLSSLIGILTTIHAWADMADINRIYRNTPSLSKIEICHAGGCAKVSVAHLNHAEWQIIEQLFQPPTNIAEQERERIADAIGLFEQIVGKKTGTDTDRAGTFKNSHYPGQLDCNDEAINTTTYMRLLKQHQLMQFHDIEDTRTRNFFYNGWPHTTAVIRDTATETRYAVDSWFYDNGYPAVIIPLEQWKAGWRPADTKAE